eukprot:Opistho-2@58367
MVAVEQRTVRHMVLLITFVGAVIFLYDEAILATRMSGESVDVDSEEEVLAAAEADLIAQPERRQDWRGLTGTRGGLPGNNTVVFDGAQIRKFVSDLPRDYVVGKNKLLDRLIDIEQTIVEKRRRKPNVIMRGTKWTQKRDMDTYRVSPTCGTVACGRWAQHAVQRHPLHRHWRSQRRLSRGIAVPNARATSKDFAHPRHATHPLDKGRVLSDDGNGA